MDEKLEHAKELLRQVVFKHREQPAGMPAKGGLCGLGDRSPVFAGLSPALAAMVRDLFARGVASNRLQPIFQGWLDEKDRFDRDRNHFLKSFRQRHGADRKQYDGPAEREFSEGLDHLNGAENLRLEERARELLAAVAGMSDA